MSTAGKNVVDALQIASRALKHVGHYTETLLAAAAPTFLIYVVLQTLLLRALTTKPDPGMILAYLAAILVQLWLTIPLIVFCHRLVLFGPDSVQRGVPLRWGRTEWRFFGCGILVGLLALAISLPIVFIITAGGFLSPGAGGARPLLVSMSLSLPVALICGLAILYAPIVVVGGRKPIATSFGVLWRRRGLWLALFGSYMVAVLIVNNLALVAVRYLAASLGFGAIVGGLIMATLAVIEAVLAATGLSFLYLHVRDDLPPEALPSDSTPAVA